MHLQPAYMCIINIMMVVQGIDSNAYSCAAIPIFTKLFGMRLSVTILMTREGTQAALGIDQLRALIFTCPMLAHIQEHSNR